jgi:hypothetical protein
MLSFDLICAFIDWALGMCERVRTRNALHEVGAALTRDEHETRSSTGVERQRELVNHNLTFSIPLIIINIFII